MSKSDRDNKIKSDKRFVAIIPFKYTHYNLKPFSSGQPGKDELQVEVAAEGLYFKNDIMHKRKLIPRNELPSGFPQNSDDFEKINSFMPQIIKLINPQNVNEDFYFLIPSEVSGNKSTEDTRNELGENANFWAKQLGDRVNAKPSTPSIIELHVPEPVEYKFVVLLNENGKLPDVLQKETMYIKMTGNKICDDDYNEGPERDEIMLYVHGHSPVVLTDKQSKEVSHAIDKINDNKKMKSLQIGFKGGVGESLKCSDYGFKQKIIIPPDTFKDTLKESMGRPLSKHQLDKFLAENMRYKMISEEISRLDASKGKSLQFSHEENGRRVNEMKEGARNNSEYTKLGEKINEEKSRNQKVKVGKKKDNVDDKNEEKHMKLRGSG